MRGTILLILTLTCLKVTAQAQRPKLVVGIVVDQMKQEYLQRFDTKYGKGGFLRLMTEGFYARNNHYNYAPTYTGPGHASIYTGTTPRYHGIIANDWYSRELGRPVYCVGDTAASNLGGSARQGKISPKNLEVNTITDELKLTTNFRSKVIALSLKDRGAVLPGGHAPDGVYWYDFHTGQFMTSTYYQTALPTWVSTFNSKKPVDAYTNQTWAPLLPISQYVESTADNTPYERGFKGKETPTFPYDLKKLRKQNPPYALILTTPYGNSLLFDLGRAAIEGERLGQDEITDFLSISLSSTDYIGHNFGPNSIELQDTYLRLDQDLAQFLEYLDTHIGKGEYLLFLTADHGAVANPRLLEDHQLPGGYYPTSEVSNKFSEALSRTFKGGEHFISHISNNQVFLKDTLITGAGYSLEEVQTEIALQAMKLPYVSDALTAIDARSQDYITPVKAMLQNGYHNYRSGDVLIAIKPGYLEDTYGYKGSSHGSVFTYDTHVPLLFLGKGVAPGSSTRATYITDIAPTLAMLMNISIPNAAISGQPISDAIQD